MLSARHPHALISHIGEQIKHLLVTAEGAELAPLARKCAAFPFHAEAEKI